MLSERKQSLLKMVVDKYIETAEPVGSKFLIDTSGLNVSAATVRNEMRDLEEMGLLTHPHTSAGRVPTEEGYRFYVDNLMIPSRPKAGGVDSILQSKIDKNAKLKLAAKYMSNFIFSAVIVRIDRNSLYYTGLSNLFAQPEFRDLNLTINVSILFDECEEKIDELCESIDKDETKVMIGRKNPLGHMCATVASKLGNDSLFAIVGTMRMPYSKAVGILNYARESYRS